MSPDEKTDFWKSLGDAKTQAEQEHVVVQSLRRRVIESRLSGSRGEFQPLSWYANQGYDVDRIKKFCKDTDSHPILGTTYRVDIRYQDKKQEQQRIRDEIIKSIEEKKKAASTVVANAKAKAKGKAKAVAGESTTASKKQQNDAVKILAKVSPGLFAMKAMQKNKRLSGIPQQHIDSLKDHIEKLSKLEQEAQACVSKMVPLASSMPEVQAACISATQHSNLMQGLLASLG